MDKLGAGDVCSDPVVVQNYLADPLVYHGGMQVRWGLSIMNALDDITGGGSQLACCAVSHLLLQLQGDRVCNVPLCSCCS